MHWTAAYWTLVGLAAVEPDMPVGAEAAAGTASRRDATPASISERMFMLVSFEVTRHGQCGILPGRTIVLRGNTAVPTGNTPYPYGRCGGRFQHVAAAIASINNCPTNGLRR